MIFETDSSLLAHRQQTGVNCYDISSNLFNSSYPTILLLHALVFLISNACLLANAIRISLLNIFAASASDHS